MCIPFNIVITAQRPDIVLIDKSSKPHTVWLFKLTVSFEMNVEQAHNTDIEDAVYSCKNMPFEVGSRGLSI